MDRFSREKLEDEAKDIISNSHLGELNGNKDVSVHISVQRGKKAPLPPNIMVFQKFAYLSATKLKPSSNRILMLFLSMSSYENWLGMDVKTIQEELDISKKTVIQALSELEDNNIIIKTINPQDHRRHDYFINPLSAWKGNSNTRKKMIQNLKIHTNQLSLFPNDINIISDDKGLYGDNIHNSNLPSKSTKQIEPYKPNSDALIKSQK